MIKYTNADKTLVVPSGLGNFGQGSGSGGGVTPQQAAEIASAVTEAAIDEYDIEIQVDLEELRDAISASTGTLLDLAEIAAMSVADRVALFDEIFEKASNGEKIYIKGLVQEETIRTAILPLVSYRPETNPVLHQGGNLYFAAKGDTDNVYFHIGLTSEGAIDPTSGNIIKRNIYNLPTASAEVKGGVRVGSGLTMVQDTLSVDTTGLVTDGDLAPFIVQQSANTQDIASLSAATEAISESLGNYATTATTDALSAVTSALTENVDALSAVTSALTENLETLSGGTPTIYSAGTAYTWCVIYDYDTINSLSTNQKKDIFSEIRSYGGQGKFTYIRKLGESGRNQFFPQSKLTSTKAEYFSLGGENYDYVTLTSAGLLSNGYKAIYTLPTAAANKKGGVKVGSGLTMNGEVMNVNIGEGLAFSGDTLVVSGGSSNTKVVFLNKLTQQERVDLYNELSSKYDYNTQSWTSAYTEDEYAFFLDLREYSEQQQFGTADTFEGFFRMQITRMHPTDYDGGAFFAGLEGDRHGQGRIVNIRFVITHDGGVDKGSWINTPPPEAKPRGAYIVISDSGGTPESWNINNVDQYCAQWNDRNMDGASFSMFLCYTAGDAERYRGNLQNYRKNYNGVNGNHFFRFIIDIEGTEYEAEYYWDKANSRIVKIVFQPYKDYLQSILNS